jgi:hypothetical protein
LEDLLGVPVPRVHTDRLYAGLDRLLPLKEAIEKHLKDRLGQLFDIDYDLLLYDVTSTYFEGDCLQNPLARRGYSRDQRPDRPQVCLGLVVTRDGLPLGYEVFAGNRHDSTTVQEIVQTMEAKHGRAGRIWVMDRGMVSEANLRFLREREGQYIVGTPKALLRSFERQLTEQDWQEVQAGVEVKLVPGPDGSETFVLTRSADRRLKEEAMHQRFLERLEAGLQKLQAAGGQRPSARRSPRQSALGPLAREKLACGQSVHNSNRTAGRAARPRATPHQLHTRSAMDGMGGAIGGLLHSADESERHRRGDVVEALHPIDRSGVGLSDHEG